MTSARSRRSAMPKSNKLGNKRTLKREMPKLPMTNDAYYETAPTNIKKAFGQLKQTGATFNTLKFLCDKLGVSYHSPGWLGDQAVHFTFPDHKVAIFINPGVQKIVVMAKKREFTSHGWFLGVIHKYQILSMDSDELEAHLVSLLDVSKILSMDNGPKKRQLLSQLNK